MNSTQNSKSFSLRKLMYPILSALVVVLVGVCFYTAVSFLSANLKQLYTVERPADQTIYIDLAQLQLVAKKLGIEIKNSTALPVESTDTKN